MKALLITILLIIPITTQAANLELPEGWRILRLSELKGTADYASRTEGEDFLSASGDFDGDGIKDAARFMVKNDGSEYAIFITTHNKSKPVHRKQFSTTRLNEIANVGVSLAQPGEHKTACGKGYWDCESGEPSKIFLKNPGIDFFYFESAGSLIYWNDKLHKFEEIATSD